MLLVEQYEQQYAVLIAEITSKIAEIKQLQGVEHRDVIAKIDASFTEAQELLELITIEIPDLDTAIRPGFQHKLSCAQVELKRLQGDYRRFKVHVKQVQKQCELSGSGDGCECDYYDNITVGNDQRQRLLQNSECIEHSGNRLANGYCIALETELLGTQVLENLSHQRDVLQSARARLVKTSVELGRASRTLNSMMVHLLREKTILCVIAICFLVAVCLSLYLAFSANSPKT